MDLFSPLRAGDIDLANRITLAPMTRLRAEPDGTPTDLIAEFYEQRASFGLLVTEGTYPEAAGKTYPGQPGIETPAQVDAWRRVTDRVHDAGGRIVLQLMHGGRVSHEDVTGTGRIVGPSAIAIDGEVRTPTGKAPFPVPHALDADELAQTRRELVAAARRAIDAGFDGVEVHGANGYLLHQFLSPASNTRDDEFGGSPERRARFVAEVVEAIAAEIGAGRTALRVSPAHNIQDVFETDEAETAATYGALVDRIAPLGLAYLSILQADMAGGIAADLRRRFGGVVVGNTGFAAPTSLSDATEMLERRDADAVAVGRAGLANPDLVERWRAGAELNEVDQASVYASGAEGYTDYPALAGADSR